MSRPLILGAALSDADGKVQADAGISPPAGKTQDTAIGGRVLLPAIYAGQALTAQQVQSFLEFPPRQKPASFNLDTVLEKMREAADGGLH